jgi:TPR repeat protein
MLTGARGLRLAVMAAAMLCAAPVLGTPKVVTLGGGDTDTDPVAACGDFAASPYEDGRDGRGATDDQVFLDGALRACEAAVAAKPDSIDAQTWLARVYILVGRAKDAAPLLESAVAGGNGFAAYLLSTLLDNSVTDGVDDDPDRSLTLLKQAADAGFAPAAIDLAGRYELGTGVELDYTEATRLYQLAADKGDAHGLYKLGFFYHGGYGIDPDFARAMQLYTEAASKGEPAGWNGIGQLYQNGQGVDVDYLKAADAYQSGTDLGEPMSMTALAYLYEQGLGVTQDYDKSFALLADAAKQNYGFAQAALALHYLFGEGTPIDAQKAFDLAWAAQSKGVKYAEGILGYMYSEGAGTGRDLSAALFHFQAGADGGDQYSVDRASVTQTEIACQDAAGSPYEPGGVGHGLDFDAIDADAAIAACEAALQVNATSVGDSVWLARAYVKAGDFTSALPLLDQGLAAGNVLAQATYADLLLHGDGLTADAPRALELYESASSKGFAPAALTLGKIYAEGDVVPADPQQALGLLQVALDSGVDGAAEEIAKLGTPPNAPNAADLEIGFGQEGPAY